ncbi:TylF/MycF family methyltransferase [Planktomarina temperata]|nr:TylF/MycF family methyltransferase [Planktomarina temperata]
MIQDDYLIEIQKLILEKNISVEEMLINYLAFVRRRDLPRLLAHYEIFKEIVNMPGSIIEVGVYKGSGLFTWANLLETFCPGDRNRLVYGFDDFEGYNKYGSQDINFKKFIEEKNHFLVSDYDFMSKLLELKTKDNILSGVKRAEIINGDVLETLKDFVEKNAGLRVCLLYIDVSLYRPTLFALEQLYDLVVPGGIVAFNGYGQVPHEGEGKALDEFLNKRGLKPELRRFNFSPMPSVFFTKT